MSKDKGNMTNNFLDEILQAQQADPAPAAPVTPAAPAPAAPSKLNKAQRTASVYLSNEQHEKLSSIARELQTNKHAVMKLAIRQFIERWDKGERPEPLYKKVYF